MNNAPSVISTDEVRRNLRAWGFLVAALLEMTLGIGCRTLAGPLANSAKVEVSESSEGLRASVLKFENLGSGEKLPAVVVLHGKDQDGDDMIGLWEEEAAKRRIQIIAPDWDNWDLKGIRKKKGVDVGALASSLEEILQKYPVDRERLALSGVSAGGLVARWVFQIKPEKWKAVIFIASASGENWWMIDGRKMPPFFFAHGGEDDQFPTVAVQRNVEGMRKMGISVEWLEDPEGGHEHRPEWTPKILDWLEKNYSRMR